MGEIQTRKIIVQDQSAVLAGNASFVSNSVNYYRMQFAFDTVWDGFAKTAVFKTEKVEPLEVILDADNTCIMPWEVLQEAARTLSIGVFGTKGDMVLPTVYVHAAVIEGTERGETAEPPQPDVYSQILALLQDAVDTAKTVRQDADAGKFDGADGDTPVRGTDYWTESDKNEIVQDVLASLTNGDEVIY